MRPPPVDSSRGIPIPLNLRARHDPEEVDEQGDAVFRFTITPSVAEGATLAESYRLLVRDLLGVVQLHYRGEPVLVDGFAFRNAPEEILPILERSNE